MNIEAQARKGQSLMFFDDKNFRHKYFQYQSNYQSLAEGFQRPTKTNNKEKKKHQMTNFYYTSACEIL